MAAPVQKWYVAYFGVQNFAKILKENLEKRKTVVFRKRISAKTTVFSVFKSVNLVEKKRRHQNLSAAGARSYSQGVVLYSYSQGVVLQAYSHMVKVLYKTSEIKKLEGYLFYYNSL